MLLEIVDNTICYGRSVVTIADQLFGTDTSLSDEEKTKKAQKIYDAVLNAFPQLRRLMNSAQAEARKYGYTETILGRRRHIPDMQLPEFEFVPLPGYVNPDIDPLDITTLNQKSMIPDRIVEELTKEFHQYKYFGQIARRTKELHEEKIKVINNRPKITDASRKCVNSKIQGSAAELTKMAMLRLAKDAEWAALGGRLLVPVHDELVAEVPIQNAEKGAEVLSRCMCEAGDFLPFGINCDVETTLRWYGCPYPCPFPEPNDMNTQVPEEISWIQYCLTEAGYDLPVYKEADGSKPRGLPAKGMNGVRSPEMESYVADYISKYRITPEEFLSHISRKTFFG